MLHDMHLNVFAFDYRGAGRSGERPHPNEERMQQDAEAAWRYLTGLRGFAPKSIIIFGAGVGASLALHLIQQHPDAGMLILRNADANVLQTVLREPRSRFFPVRLLFHDRFPLTGLPGLTTPKLLLDAGPADQGPERRARIDTYRAAADPKVVVVLPASDPAGEAEAIRRFLDSTADNPQITVQPVPVA